MSVFGSVAEIQSYCKNPNHAQRRPNHRSDDRSKENWETHEIERENTKKKWKRSSQGVSPAVVRGRAAARIAAVAGRRGRDRGARGVENANEAAESRSRSRPGAEGLCCVNGKDPGRALCAAASLLPKPPRSFWWDVGPTRRNWGKKKIITWGWTHRPDPRKGPIFRGKLRPPTWHYVSKRGTAALLGQKKAFDFDTIVFLFLFNKYCSIIK